LAVRRVIVGSSASGVPHDTKISMRDGANAAAKSPRKMPRASGFNPAVVGAASAAKELYRESPFAAEAAPTDVSLAPILSS